MEITETFHLVPFETHDNIVKLVSLSCLIAVKKKMDQAS